MRHTARGAFAVLWSLALLFLSGCGETPPNLQSTGHTVVCFGDSVTAGVGRGKQPAYPQILGQMLRVPVINAGVPGDTAEQGLARVGSVLSRDPWLVVIEFGGNDILRQIPVERTERALSAIIQRVLGAHAVPLLIGVHGPFGGQHKEMFERLSDRYDVPLIADALPHILLSPELKSDPIHPNGNGYEALAQAVAQRVQPWLAARKRAAS